MLRKTKAKSKTKPKSHQKHKSEKSKHKEGDIKEEETVDTEHEEEGESEEEGGKGEKGEGVKDVGKQIGFTKEEQEEYIKRYKKGFKEGSEGDFTAGFVEYLLMHIIKDDEEAVWWFEWLMCGGKNPTKTLDPLFVSHSICAARLDRRRWHYECKTCQHDDTCVICADCFNDSDHTGHNVRRAIVLDGTCDCGDPESWAPSGFCSKHKGPNEDSDFRTLPPDLLRSASTAFASVIDVILTAAGQIDATYLFPQKLDYCDSDHEMWATMLYNDEVHSFEAVILQLIEANPEIDRQRAENFALRVDSQGECVVYVGTKKQCEHIMKILTKAKPPLISAVSNTISIIHEEIVQGLVECLVRLCLKSDSLRNLCCKVLSLPPGDTNVLANTTGSSTQTQSRLDILITSFESLAPEVKQSFSNWVSALMKDHTFKKEMGVGFARNYPHLVKRLFHTSTSDLLDRTVHIFTMRDTAYRLTVEHGLLRTIVKTLLSTVETHFDTRTNSTILNVTEYEPYVQLFEYMFYDISYIFTASNVASYVAAHEISLFLELQKLGQGLYPNKRALLQHVESESNTDWSVAFIFTQNLLLQHDMILQKLSAEELLHVDEPIFATLCEWLNKLNLAFSSESAELPTIVVPENLESSYNIPLHRMYSCLLQHASKLGIDKELRISQVKDMRTLMKLLEHPLQIFVMSIQVFAGMWVRNGFAMVNQNLNYRTEGSLMQPVRRDRVRAIGCARDLFLIQVLATKLPVDHFMNVLVSRFDLASFFSEEPNILETATHDPKKMLSVAEQFLEFVISIVSHRASIGEMSEEDVIRDILIHMLFLGGSCTHSLLCARLAPYITENPLFEKLLDEVAVFKRSAEQSKYVLKEEYYPRFNRFFWEYTRKERENAEEIYEKKKLSADPPPLFPLRPQFAQINDILTCKVTNDMIFFSLVHALIETPFAHSMLMLSRVFHLLKLQISEVWAKSNPENAKKFLASLTEVRPLKNPRNFSVPGTSSSIFVLLLYIRAKFPHLKDTMWILEKCFEVDPSLKEDFEATIAAEEIDRSSKKRRQEEAKQKLLEQFSKQQLEFAKTIEGADIEEEDEEDHSHHHLAVCILCRESSPLYSESKPLGAIMSTQKSLIIGRSKNPKDAVTVVKCCGHVMHMDCCFDYWSSLREKHSRGQGYEGSNVFEEGEFACPICKTISEFVIPIVSLPGQTRTGSPLIGPNLVLTIPDDPEQAIQEIKAEPHIEDRPSVMISMQMFLDKIAPAEQFTAAVELCTGTTQLIEFSSRSNTLPLSALVKEKDMKHLTYLLDTTRAAVTGLAPHAGVLDDVPRVTFSPNMDILASLVTMCARVPAVDYTQFATHFVSLFRVLLVVGVVQCILQADRDITKEEEPKKEKGKGKEQVEDSETTKEKTGGDTGEIGEAKVEEERGKKEATEEREEKEREKKRKEERREDELIEMMTEGFKRVRTNFTAALRAAKFGLSTDIPENSEKTPEENSEKISENLKSTSSPNTQIFQKIPENSEKTPEENSEKISENLKNTSSPNIQNFQKNRNGKKGKRTKAKEFVKESFGQEYLQRLCTILDINSSVLAALGPYLETLRTFARSAAILFAALFSLPLPPIPTLQEEFPTLLTYLHLPPQTLSQPFPQSFEPFVRKLLATENPHPHLPLPTPPTPFSLVPIATSFYDYWEPLVGDVVCGNCHSRFADTLMCLVCGAAVCPARSCCKQQKLNLGECVTHARECCGDFGVYLTLDRNIVLAMFKGITGITAPIYLDPYGEEDVKLERGLPMTYSKERYEQVRELVVNHSMSSIGYNNGFVRWQV